MYLSRVELDETRHATMRALSAPQKIHGAVESAFLGERQRRLWRLDRLGGKLYLLLLSEQKPDLESISAQFGPVSGTSNFETRNYTQLLEQIEPGSVWQFRLTANPTKRCSGHSPSKGRGKVLAQSYQQQWLLERAEKHGFRLSESSFIVTNSHWIRFSKHGDPGHPVSLLSVTYEGVLQVTQPELFCAMLTHGIGRGKAYGLGLMTVIHRR